MRVTKLKLLFFLPLFLFFIFSCGDEDAASEKTNDVVSEEYVVDDPAQEDDTDKIKNIICMWKAVSLKETPSSKGKYIGLAEKLTGALDFKFLV
ncbi:MAG: hypothetical protein L3J35_01240 [Bacteroidales bacterium]|nr:hypothetical protein [Bacteroidales bacterium]